MELLSLDEVFDFIRNGASIKQGIEGGYPITRIETIANGYIDIEKMGYAGIESLEKFSQYILQNGDILMSHINSEKHLGKTAIYENLDIDIIHGMNLLCLRPNMQKLLPKYAYYYLNNMSFKGQISQITKKSVNQASLSVSDLKKLKIYVPLMDNQIKIANTLDQAQSLINKRRAQIEDLNKFIQSVFWEMFGDPVINPKTFVFKKLIDLAEKVTDGTHNSPPMAECGIPYITAKHLKLWGLDFYANPTYISAEDHEKIYQRCNPVEGDVIYIKDGATTGIAGINKYDFQFSMLSSLALIKNDKTQINNYYLVYYLNNSRVKEKIIGDMVGGAIKRLTLARINNIRVLVPPLELQKQFAQIAQKTEQQKDLLKQSLTQLEDNFNSLMQKAFKGELFN